MAVVVQSVVEQLAARVQSLEGGIRSAWSVLPVSPALEPLLPQGLRTGAATRCEARWDWLLRCWGRRRPVGVGAGSSASPTSARKLRQHWGIDLTRLLSVPEMAELTDLLRRLGILTLGDLAGLPERDVVNRFGAEGAHRLARGGDRRLMSFAAPPRDFERAQSFEPTLTRIEEAAFTVRTTAEEFIAAFAKAQLVGDRQRRHFSQPGG